MKSYFKVWLPVLFLLLMMVVVLNGCSSNSSASLSAAKSLTSFSFTNPLATGVIDENAKTISITVPHGTNVTALKATFITTGESVKVGAMVQVSGATPNDFSNPVVYTVTAADGTTSAYRVTVTIALSSAKAITAFGLTNPLATGVIDENAKTISITVPFGTDVTSLAATFITTGVSVKVGTTDQVSATTLNDFTSPVVYTVTAADGTTAAYTVTVTIAPSSSKSITAFSLLGIQGTIDENAKTISITVPYGTNVTALVATFATTGESVAVGAAVQVSGTTPNDFTSPVVYTVTAADTTTTNYTVTVTVALNPAKAITAFSFASPAATGIIDENAKTISITVPHGTNVTALVATFSTTGASVTVGTTAQVSGTTPNDFTSPVVYTVTAADTTTTNYTVTVTVALNPAKAITAFSFASPAATGTIDENAKSISITVPYGTEVTALVATFATTGTSVTVGTTAQVSGTTPNDFTSPVVYTVTAADTTTTNYTVTVTVAPNPAKAITAFSFASPPATGTIDENAKTISITVPYGTNVTALVATFSTTGASVTVGTTAQVSGATSNDFTNPVVYTVTAADSTTADYTVTVAMASPITWQATSAGHLESGSGGGTLVFTHTTSSGSNRILIVSAMLRNALGGYITTATYNGHQLTLIKEISQSSAERVKMWYMLEPPVGTYDVVITYNGSHYGLDGTASTYTGVSQNRPYSHYAANGAYSSAGPATVTVLSAPGELVVDALGYRNGGSITPQGTQTERYNQSYTAQTAGVSEKNGASSVTMSWALQNPDTWAMIAVALRPALSPNVRTVTVKPSGGDYTSLQAALAGEAADLVALNRQLNIECYSMSDSVKVNIPGAFVTDPDRYIKIYTPPSERHGGTWDNSKYRLEITATTESGEPYPTCIWLKGRHVWFDGIQVKCSSLCTNYPSIFVVDPLPLSAVTMRFSNNILVGNFTGGTVTNSNAWVNLPLTSALSDSLFYLWNTEVRDIACQDGPSGGRMIHVSSPSSSETWFIDNVTLYNAYQALSSGLTASFHVRNSIAAGLLPGGNSWAASKTTPESDYNTSSNAETLQGSHSKSGVTPLFVDIPGRDLRLQASDTVAKDSGADMLNNPLVNGGVDGKGTTRLSPWDIGAYEY